MGDMRITPVGIMPGMYLIANGLDMLLTDNQLKKIGVIKDLLIRLVIIYTVAAILYFLSNGHMLMFTLLTAGFVSLSWLIPEVFPVKVHHFVYLYHVKASAIVFFFYDFMLDLEDITGNKFLSRFI
jgi:hypothetical protein